MRQGPLWHPGSTGGINSWASCLVFLFCFTPFVMHATNWPSQGLSLDECCWSIVQCSQQPIHLDVCISVLTFFYCIVIKSFIFEYCAALVCWLPVRYPPLEINTMYSEKMPTWHSARKSCFQTMHTFFACTGFTSGWHSWAVFSIETWD